MNKSIIFHIPFKIDPKLASGTNIRPLKMLQAFKDAGFEVDVVMGYGKERKEQISKIKAKIRQKFRYDFIYSESSTIPTLLTEKNHLPTFPLLDFSFFSFCKQAGIPIGLFYRDIFWNFEAYKLKGLKAMLSKAMYHYDLYQYNKLVNTLFLPSFEMLAYLPQKMTCKVLNLPPGSEMFIGTQKENISSKLSLLYVGGIGVHYQLGKLFKTVSKLDFVQLKICTRVQDWEEHKIEYEAYLKAGNISVVHQNKEELEHLYRASDICMLFVEDGAYWKFAVPVKLFEYLGHQKPIISTKNTYPGNFIEENKIGWSIEYNEEKLAALLEDLYANKLLIEDKMKKVKEVALKNTWLSRALKVAETLTLPHG